MAQNDKKAADLQFIVQQYSSRVIPEAEKNKFVSLTKTVAIAAGLVGFLTPPIYQLAEQSFSNIPGDGWYIFGDNLQQARTF